MAQLKTAPTGASVTAFLNRIKDAERRRDCRTVLGIMRQATKSPPRMWGKSIVGFGRYHYKYESGREGHWFLTGPSPRKQDLTLYITPGFARYGTMMRKLGKYKTGVSCLYVKRLADLDTGVLRALVRRSVADMRRFPASLRGNCFERPVYSVH